MCEIVMESRRRSPRETDGRVTNAGGHEFAGLCTTQRAQRAGFLHDWDFDK